MKRILTLLSIPLLIIVTACGETNNAQSGDIVVETSVGNITEEEFVQQLKDLYGETVLNELVQKKVLLSKGEELGIGEEEIQSEIDTLKESLEIEDDQQFQQFLQMQGIQSEADLRERFLSHLVLQNLVGHVGEFTEDELREEYELGLEVEARHILVNDIETAEELLERARGGEDFGELAKEYSQDPGSKDDGGNLGFFQRGIMTPPFEEAAFYTEVGSISEPVPTNFGYHIIEVTDRKEFEDSFEEVMEKLRDTLNNRKLYHMSQMQEELFENVEVNVLDEQFKLPKFTN
ncbi:foldase protein PrsA [Evansella vedderi]|uniref:Foldase protein PrsA n=1 Tax=Evansella vedderi TaxID=38282 RepID=A0ABT9ZTM4_9BACI|nr:peptidylprolyl isomerase [Evansella vedderi]MDQ0254214.1 foldase protein PrsA [Evansella vedderi]